MFKVSNLYKLMDVQWHLASNETYEL